MFLLLGISALSITYYRLLKIIEDMESKNESSQKEGILYYIYITFVLYYIRKMNLSESKCVTWSRQGTCMG